MPPLKESFADPSFPILGIDLSTGYHLQRPGTTILGENVRGFEPDTQRSRGGSRPGLDQYIRQQIPGGEHLIQCLNFVVSASGTALIANYNDQAPDLYDPSSFGPFGSWPPFRFTRSPALPIPRGGWGIQPNKNQPETLHIAWANPALIQLGTPLSSTQLNAVAQDRVSGNTVPGAYTYKPVSGTFLHTGIAIPLHLTFTPTDQVRYRETLAVAAIDVVLGGGGGKTALTITANSFTKADGVNYTFDGTEFTVSGLTDGDTVVTVSLSSDGAEGGALPGIYPIVPSGAVFNPFYAEDRYDIAYNNGTLTVGPAGPATLTVTARNANKVFGDTITPPADGHGFYDVTGTLLPGDVVTSVTITSAGFAAGAAAPADFPITASALKINGANPSGSYSITYVDGDCNVFL